MHQANPAESVVKKAKVQMRMKIEEVQSGGTQANVDWEPFLPEVQKTLNAMPMKNRGYSIPFTTLTGRPPRTPFNLALREADVDLSKLFKKHTNDDDGSIDFSGVESDLLAAGLEAGLVRSYISGFRVSMDKEYTKEDADEFVMAVEKQAVAASDESAENARKGFEDVLETRKRKAISEGATVELLSLVSVPVPGVRDRSTLVPSTLPAIVVQFESSSSTSAGAPFTLAASTDGPLAGRYEASSVSKGFFGSFLRCRLRNPFDDRCLCHAVGVSFRSLSTKT